MTLTNEQCIQVAEKVWGWKRKAEDKATANKEGMPPRWIEPGSDPLKSINRLYNAWQLKHEIESWSGFGRTVEAMAEKKLNFLVEPSSVMFWSADRSIQFAVPYTRNPFNKEHFIEATHLAALEAIDAEGS